MYKIRQKTLYSFENEYKKTYLSYQNSIFINENYNFRSLINTVLNKISVKSCARHYSNTASSEIQCFAKLFRISLRVYGEFLRELLPLNLLGFSDDVCKRQACTNPTEKNLMKLNLGGHTRHEISPTVRIKRPKDISSFLRL